MRQARDLIAQREKVIHPLAQMSPQLLIRLGLQDLI